MRIVKKDIENLILWREKNDENALVDLINNNIKLVFFFANKFLDNGLTFEELTSAGIEGLLKAINHYDYTDDTNAFSTYIGLSIKRTIEREVNRYEKHTHVLSLEQAIIKKYDEDEILKIEEVIGTDPEQVVEEAMSNIKNTVIKDILKQLTPKEQAVIILRYGIEEKSLAEIAEMFNCTRQAVYDREKSALKKLRHPKNIERLRDFID